jgi:hypothetical protein
VILLADKNATGKKVSQEQSISSKLREMLKTDAKVYFILWKYAPNLLPKQGIKTFKDLTDNYKTFTDGMTEEFCNNWLCEKNVQTAVKWLLKRIHQEKLVELYNIYFEMAKKDTGAFKAFTEFSEKFFAEEKDSELLSIVQGISDDDLEE